MKWIAVCLAAAFAMSPPALSRTACAAEPVRPAMGIEPAMEDIEGALDVLGRQIKDPAKRDANLALLSKMQHAALICKQQTPEPARKLAGEAQTKMLDTYRTMLITLMRELLHAEEHLIASRYDEAAAAVAKLESIKEAGHKALGVEGH